MSLASGGALERMLRDERERAPRREREELARAIFVTHAMDMTAADAFDHADEWLAERDRRRKVK